MDFPPNAHVLIKGPQKESNLATEWHFLPCSSQFTYNQYTRLRATTQSHIPSTPCLEAIHWCVESIQRPRFSPLIVGICHQGPHDSSFTEQGTKTSERWSPWSQSLGWVVFFWLSSESMFAFNLHTHIRMTSKTNSLPEKWWSLYTQQNYHCLNHFHAWWNSWFCPHTTGRLP